MKYLNLLLILVLCFFFTTVRSTTVSLHNLQTFFNQTYDMNHDGYATLQ